MIPRNTVHMNSSGSSPKRADFQALRALLQKRYPEAHRRVEAGAGNGPVMVNGSGGGPLLPTGIPGLDAEGVPETGLIEVVGAEASGVSLVIWSVIRQVLHSGRAVALIDSGDGCDVARAWPEEIMARLLWVRCHGVEEAVRAMDLLVRDGNVRHLIMDLRENAREGVRKSPPGSSVYAVPHPVWYRLRNVAEENALWVMVASRERTVPCAIMRCQLSGRFGLGDLSVPRETLLKRVAVEVEHRGGGGQRRDLEGARTRQAG